MLLLQEDTRLRYVRIVIASNWLLGMEKGLSGLWECMGNVVGNGVWIVVWSVGNGESDIVA